VRLAASEQLILSLLLDRERQYGLELVAASRRRLKRGGIYVTLGRMEDKGLVSSAAGESGRRLYRATPLGERALMAAKVFSGEIRMERPVFRPAGTKS
jgi:DNA-binding PadR family transcriptional regulator